MKTGKMNLSTAWIVTAMFAAFLIMGMLSFVQSAHANPFYSGTTAQSAAATSTQVRLNIGAATSTTIYDSYEQYGTNQVNAGNVTIPDKVAIIVDGVASSTASVVSIACEYSQNYNANTGNGDWYDNEIGVTSFATTTAQPLSITTPFTYSFNFASSTMGGAANATTDTRFQKITTCPVITRFVRAVVTNTVQPATVWVQIIPLKQRNSGN